MAESMAAGVPVIAMDLGSCREVVKDRRPAISSTLLMKPSPPSADVDRIDRRHAAGTWKRTSPSPAWPSGTRRSTKRSFDGKQRKRSDTDQHGATRTAHGPARPSDFDPYPSVQNSGGFRHAKERFVTRYEGNPILTTDDIPYPVETVHNAGVTKYDGRYIMLFRSHLDTGRSIIGLAESAGRVPFHAPPGAVPDAGQGAALLASTRNTASKTPASRSSKAPTTSPTAPTPVTASESPWPGRSDFESVERISLITQADYRNTVLFPEKIGGRYVRLDRPHSEISPWSIWITYSPDLRPLGRLAGRDEAGAVPLGRDEDRPRRPADQDHQRLAEHLSRRLPHDGRLRSIASASPCTSSTTRPSILGVCDRWILQPEDPWEVVGYVHNVVFTCGAVPEPDGTLKLYWGGADKVMCAGTAIIDELVDACLTYSRPAM